MLVVAGLSIGGVFFIKIYYTVITVKEHIDEGKVRGASEIDVSDIVNVSVKGKDDQLSLQLDSKSFVNSRINESDNFIYN